MLRAYSSICLIHFLKPHSQVDCVLKGSVMFFLCLLLCLYQVFRLYSPLVVKSILAVRLKKMDKTKPYGETRSEAEEQKEKSK